MRRFFFLFPILILIGNCITIQLPPISVTGTKTAAEKQIIGEQRELEKDVWMISSARTTSSVDLKAGETESAPGKKEADNTLAFQGLAILEAFSEEFTELKKDGVVGENSNGLVSSLLKVDTVTISPEIREKYNPENPESSYKILVETVKQINRARELIIESYILEQRSVNAGFNPDKAELLKINKDQYRQSLQVGEYYQNDTDGSWTPKGK